jgi:hypothetical protein
MDFRDIGSGESNVIWKGLCQVCFYNRAIAIKVGIVCLILSLK